MQGRGSPLGPKAVGLSGNEILCLRFKGLAPCGYALGNSVRSLGFFGGLGAGLKSAVGGEVAAITEAVRAGREAAVAQMIRQARELGAEGVVSVSTQLRTMGGHTEYIAAGDGVRHVGETGAGRVGREGFFSSDGTAQELFCHIDAGFMPRAFAFGNIAYSVGAPRGLLAGLRTLGRGEIPEYSDVFNRTRHAALERLALHAQEQGANAVVGIRTVFTDFLGTHEMLMTGTAAHNPLLPGGEVATSDLTGEEAWAMTRLGYAPLKMIISASIHSLGVADGLMASFRSLASGELPELTELVHEAREAAFGRLRAEAAAIGADEVVGTKVVVAELPSGLIEVLEVGTAMRQVAGMRCASDQLPPQAIMCERP